MCRSRWREREAPAARTNRTRAQELRSAGGSVTFYRKEAPLVRRRFEPRPGHALHPEPARVLSRAPPRRHRAPAGLRARRDARLSRQSTQWIHRERGLLLARRERRARAAAAGVPAQGRARRGGPAPARAPAPPRRHQPLRLRLLARVARAGPGRRRLLHRDGRAGLRRARRRGRPSGCGARASSGGSARCSRSWRRSSSSWSTCSTRSASGPGWPPTRAPARLCDRVLSTGSMRLASHVRSQGLLVPIPIVVRGGRAS